MTQLDAVRSDACLFNVGDPQHVRVWSFSMWLAVMTWVAARGHRG